MAELILYPAANADDCCWSANRFSSSQLYIGRNNYSESNNAAFRFPNVTIPQGATIDSAVIALTASGYSGSNTVNVLIHANDEDAAVAPTTKEAGAALVLTTANVAWAAIGVWQDKTQYDSPDIKTVIQEIVDREGWASGNALMVVLADNSSTAGRGPYAYDYGNPSYYAKLTINYSVATETIEVPSAGLTLSIPTGIQILPIFTPVAALTLTPYSPTAGLLSQIANAPELSLSSVVPSYLVHLTKHPDVAELTLAAQLPSYVWSIPARLRPAAQVIYTCTLTGDGESPALSDLTLPMSSFQGRMRDGDPSYISAVIPNCMVYADDILARQNGDIVIKKGYRFQDGTTQLEEIARVDFESVRIDQGSKSASATISGHKTISSTSVKTVTVEGVSYYCLQADGKRRVRALLDLFLRIGDTCVYGTGTSDYLTVGYITYTVSVNQTIMEVTEA